LGFSAGATATGPCGRPAMAGALPAAASFSDCLGFAVKKGTGVLLR
jgi:hypothetical protein